jgi:ABC-type uncharacterized transport system auxiliary subunit
MNHLMLKLITIFSLLIPFSACLTQQYVPEDNFYRLSSVEPFVSPEGSPLDRDTVIVVKRFRSDLLYSERPLVYVKSDTPLHMRQYHYHKWSDPPPVMLQNYLIDFLRKTHLARTTISEGARIQPDYIISGSVKRFDHVLGQSHDKVVVTLEMEVHDVKQFERLAFTQQYTKEVKISGKDFHSTIDSFRTAVEEIYNNFFKDLVDVVERQ